MSLCTLQKLSKVGICQSRRAFNIAWFMPDYTCWSRHGEIMVGRNEVHLDLNGDNDDSNNENDDNLSGMLHDCEYDIADKDYETFISES